MKGATTYRANTNAPWRQQLHFPTHPMDAICVQNKSLHREPIRSAIAIQRVCWHEFKWRSEKDEVKELGKLAIAIRRAGRPQISTCRRICGTGFEFLFSFLFPVVDFLSSVGRNAPFSWPNHVIRIKNLLQNGHAEMSEIRRNRGTSSRKCGCFMRIVAFLILCCTRIFTDTHLNSSIASTAADWLKDHCLSWDGRAPEYYQRCCGNWWTGIEQRFNGIQWSLVTKIGEFYTILNSDII